MSSSQVDAPQQTRRMVFHAPYPLNRAATSASGIRPVRMRDAFEALGYEVWEVTGHSKERAIAARRVREALEAGTTFDFCYSESSTMPTALTDPDHLPKHPDLDFSLLRTLRRHGVRVGLFYRDIYWRFPEYGQGMPAAQRRLALEMYKYDLRQYRRATDVLYLPSMKMAPYVGADELTMKALPPGHDVTERSATAAQPLELVYVGGLIGHYRLHALVRALAEVPEAHMTLCCRENEWQAVRHEYEPLPANLKVVHRSGAELEELYERANVTVIYSEPMEYWAFAAPVKVYEYIGHGQPILASAGTLVGDFVEEGGLGWNLAYGKDEAVAWLQELTKDPQAIDQARKRVVAVADQHHWQARAAQVVSDLSVEQLAVTDLRRVLLVGSARSIHTARWVNALAERGLEVHLATVHEPQGQQLHPEVRLHQLPNPRGAGYLTAAPRLRSIIQRVAPDVVNAHYASGYGTLARLALVGLDVPYLLSVWGSDVYDFPERNRLTRTLLEQNLAAATMLASTSRSMAEHTRQFSGGKEIAITPFGIDLDRFAVRGAPTGNGRVVLGTVKTLHEKYGIDTLIEAYALARAELEGTTDLQLRLVGGGPDEQKLRELAARLGVAEHVDFVGLVPHAEVPEVMRAFDIYAALSRLDSESFGVAILEASACALPVIVSDVSGPAEVTEDEQTGLIVPRNDPRAAADAILRLVRDPHLRATMGAAGRAHVEAEYSWQSSVDTMIEAYRRTRRLAGRGSNDAE